jgi:hypothetical protein
MASLEIVLEEGIVPASVVRIENGERAFIVPAVGPDSVMSEGTHSAVKMPSNAARFCTNVGVWTFAAGAERWVCMHDADGTTFVASLAILPQTPSCRCDGRADGRRGDG